MIAIGGLIAATQFASADDDDGGKPTAQEFLDAYCGGAIPAGTELEIENGTGGVLGGDCTVTIPDNSELEIGKDVTLEIEGLFTLTDGSNSEIQIGEGNTVDTEGIDWTVGDDGEIQVKKNSYILAAGDIVMSADEEDGEVQLEENTCMVATGDIEWTSNASDGEVQIKKVVEGHVFAAPCGSPNIVAGGIITVAAGVDGADKKGEVEVEDGNWLEAEEIVMEALGKGAEAQTKKDMKMEATAGDSSILADVDPDGKVQVEEDNTFCASGTIHVRSSGQTEIKSGTELYAGGFDIVRADKDESVKDAYSECTL